MIRTYKLILGSLLFAAALAGCGDDDDTGAACPDNVTPGGSVSCACGDGGARGLQLCKPNMKLSECDCTDAINGGAGNGGSSGSNTGSSGKGASGSGGSKSGGSGGSSMSGGSGGSMSQTDGGKPPVQGNDAGPPDTTALPMDGNQLSVCKSGVDCNRGLDCYNTAAPGDGFCSKTCQSDDDCMGVSGAAYVCSQSTNICVINCMGTDDTSCPSGMVCESNLGGGFPGSGGQNGGGSGGAGGFTSPFRCGYPAGMGGTPGGAAAWTACTSPTSNDCGMGLTCNGFGAGMSGSGYCTQECMNDGGCTMAPSSGDIDPTCEPMRMGGGGPGGPGGGGVPRTCVLDCSMNENGCPDDMSCVTNMFFGTARCEFQ